MSLSNFLKYCSKNFAGFHSYRCFSADMYPEEAVNIHMDTFQGEVIDAEIPVLVVMIQDWDLKSKEMLTKLEKLFVEEDFRPEMKLCKLDVEKQPQIANAIGFETIPMVYCIHDQNVIGWFDSTIPDDELLKFLSAVHSGQLNLKKNKPEVTESEDDEDVVDVSETLEIAEYFMSREDFDQASKIYQNLLKNENYSEFHSDAIIGLAQIELRKDSENGVENAKELLNTLDMENNPLINRVLGNISLVEKQLMYSSDSDLFEAMEFAIAGKFEDALDLCFELLKKSDEMEEIRGIILLIFDCMDPSDEMVKRYRNKLMNIMF